MPAIVPLLVRAVVAAAVASACLGSPAHATAGSRPAAEWDGVRVAPADLAPMPAGSVDGSEIGASEPRRLEQFALDQIDVVPVWSRTLGAGQIVAVLDTGVDASHPDLAGQLVDGYDAVTSTPLPAGSSTDANGHGTHVAAIVAAALNSVGIAGVAPAAKVMPVKVIGDVKATSGDVAEGLQWAIDAGATVINMSLVMFGDDERVTAAVEQAQLAGITVVAATGNLADKGNPALPPATLAGVVGVGSAESDGSAAYYSEYGPQVDLVAPGTAVLSALPGGRWGWATGTSAAAPQVSAAVALLRSLPGVTGPLAVQALLDGAVDLGTPGRDDYFGVGRMRVAASLERLDAGEVTEPPPPTVRKVPTVTAGAARLDGRSRGRVWVWGAVRVEDLPASGALLHFQVKRSGVWVTVKQARVGETGRVRARLWVAKGARVRVQFSGTPTLAAATSRVMRVR